MGDEKQNEVQDKKSSYIFFFFSQQLSNVNGADTQHEYDVTPRCVSHTRTKFERERAKPYMNTSRVISRVSSRRPSV